MRRGLSVLSSLVLAAWIGIGPTAAASHPRQTYSLKFATTSPGAPTGAFLKADWLGDRPGQKPHSIIDDVFTFADGTRLDFSVPARCRATDLQLVLRGPSACPKASKVAEGEIDLDIGRTVWLIPRIVKTHVDVFSGGQGKLISLARATNIGFPIPVVDRSSVTGTSIVTRNPPLPGFPPPDRFVAVKRDRIHFLKVTKGTGDNRRGFITTPTTCPAGGEWISTATFHYRRGITEHASSPSPCTQR